MTRQLESKTARLKLAPRKKPYFIAVTPGVSLGYRRNKTAGAWIVRAADGNGGNWMKGFEVADDFQHSDGKTILTLAEAQERARTLARGGNDDKSSGDRPVTVSEAADNYEADLRARGANTYNAEMIRVHIPASLGARPVALLTQKELRTWRNDLVKAGLKPATVDRIGKSMKAALNLASTDDPRISNYKEWKDSLKSLPDGDTAHNIILPDGIVSALVRAAYEDDHELGIFIETLAATGSRKVNCCG